MDHRLIEGLMEAIAPVIRESTVAAIDKATAPLLARITELEAKTVERGEKGDRGEPGEPGADAPAPTDEQIMAAVAAYVSEHPPAAGKDGRDGIDGKDGEPGQRGEPGEPGIKGETGRDGRDGLPGVQGEKGIDGINGKDGKDGLGFDDIDVQHDGEGGFVLRFVRGDQIKEFGRFELPRFIDRGVWKGGSFKTGDGVTKDGSFWIAQRDTEGEPDTPDSGWRLAVKRGRNGRDFRPDDHARSSEPVRFR